MGMPVLGLGLAKQGARLRLQIMPGIE
jgi:hypothetical protein